MENLTLPEPAAGLWAAKRSIVHAIPPEMFGRSIPPHLGGGTILIDLLQDNDRRYCQVEATSGRVSR